MPEIPIPEGFIENSLGYLNKVEISEYLKSVEAPTQVSIRANPYKLDHKPELSPVPWSRYGFYIDQRPTFITDPLFHAGVYYVQESASMFIEQVYSQLVGEGTSLKILDLCAAPGGKTTHLSTLAGPDNLVVANEVIHSRANILKENVIKWGIGNTILTNNDPRDFNNLPEYFDIIFADVPCSGEGLFRKTPEARTEWSTDNINLCSARQKRIISDIWRSLKKDGILVYSTCTFNKAENEENIEWISEEFDCEPVIIDVDNSWNIFETCTRGFQGFHFFPHRNNSEGFFLCALRKKGKFKPTKPQTGKKVPLELQRIPEKKIKYLAGWLEQPEYMAFLQDKNGIINIIYETGYNELWLLFNKMNVLYFGIEMGKIYGSELKPSHSLAMFHGVSRSIVNTTNISLDEAVDFLRKKELDTKKFTDGINLVSYRNKPLGWLKRIGNRCNNMYPKEMRIVNPNIKTIKDSFL